MTQYYITQDGDVLDMLAYQYYGKVFERQNLYYKITHILYTLITYYLLD